MSWSFDVRVVSALRRLIESHQIDLIHTHNYRATLLAHTAAKQTPVVNTCHGQITESSLRLKFWQSLEIMAMRRQTITIACSDFVRHWLLSRGLKSDRVETVYNATPEPPTLSSDITRASLGIRGDSLVVLYAGRLINGKGLDTLLHGAARVPKAHVVLLGEGDARAALESLAQSLGARTYFSGFVASPAPYYALADLIVLPSHMEALPMSLLEAMAHGKAVIASNVGGIPEVVTDGETGILVEPGDVNGFMQALVSLKDPDRRHIMGRNARARWQEHFTLDLFAERLMRAYRKALV